MSLYPLFRATLLPPFLPKIDLRGGEENLPPAGQGYILAPNHIDWLDGFYLSAILNHLRHVPLRFLTASNNYWWTGVAVQIPLLKTDAIDRAVLALRHGAVICNFPEGSRNPRATLLPGKTGTVRMAALADVPVIPVGIHGSSQDTYWQAIRQVRQPNDRVGITIGTPRRFPIPPGGITAGWLETSTRELMAAIAPLAGKSQ